MKNSLTLISSLLLLASACSRPDGAFYPVHLKSTADAVQPGTGLVLWSDNAEDRNATYGKSITLEYAYCLPCDVVTGKQGEQVQYDWSGFDAWLDDVASRNHQAVVRFRYEYPGDDSVDGNPGTTAVPAYIKALPDYHETFNENEDGETWYADWTNKELKWFTKQFYADFNARYATDPRIAFLELGFGHWSEYHIFGTPVDPGVNFPSDDYQKEFLTYVDGVLDIPWAISIDAADNSPIVDDDELMALTFGLFDDSFMHEDHEGDYNEECWDAIGEGTRWQTGVCGGEISYYTSADQKNFLNPAGMYGVTWEQASAKYHITFMIANDAPRGSYGTAERFKSAGVACGYRFRLTSLTTSVDTTVAEITNDGIAPIYRDAYLAVEGVRSKESLKGLLPGQTLKVTVPRQANPDNVTIESDFILPGQTIQFDADL